MTGIEVSAASLSAASMAEVNALQAGPVGLAAGLPPNQAVVRLIGEPVQAGRTGLPAVEGLVDKVRGEFDAFRARLSTDSPVRHVNSGPQAALTQGLTEAMNSSLRTQMQIFQVSVAFHAGLTVTQQSQSGVKTLVEKA